MMDSRDDGLNFDDNNRLPWLETADGQEGTDGGSPLKIVFMVVFGLALLTAIAGGAYWFQNSQSRGANGNGALIAAPKGDYKEKPADAGGWCIFVATCAKSTPSSVTEPSSMS